MGMLPALIWVEEAGIFAATLMLDSQAEDR